MRIRKGSIEVLGYAGLIIWLSVIIERMWSEGLGINAMDTFIIGIAPSIGAAWLVTMVGKFVVIFGFKQDLTIKKHFLICVGVLAVAFVSEVIHDAFLHGPFDVWDMVATGVAQLIIFLLPILIRDRYFNNYNQAAVERTVKKRIVMGLLGFACGLALILAVFTLQQIDGFLSMMICLVSIYLMLSNTIRLFMINEHFADIIMDFLTIIFELF